MRDYELKLMAEAGVEVPESASKYSINENLLGVTLSGREIDRFEAPADDTRVRCRPRAEWPDEPGFWTLGFEHGRAVSSMAIRSTVRPCWTA